MTMAVSTSSEIRTPHKLDSAEIGAIAHLYRAEIYRSTIWRTRLDNTTNWAIVTMGIALSVTFANKDSSPLPLVLVGLLMMVFLIFESRRYRYFNVWRARARWMEKHFYARLLRGEPISVGEDWSDELALDYRFPRYHISGIRAAGRRLRRNYLWILAIQDIAYYGKVAIHPTPIASWADLWDRTAVGPIRGEVMIVAGILYTGGWIAFALVTLYLDRQRHRTTSSTTAMG
jgi:uncharacterized membrane protein